MISISSRIALTDVRILPLQRDQLSTAIRQEGLDNLWVVERAMEYHMLCGGTTEAAWLADTLGDWKTAFLLGVSIVKHEKMAPQLYERYSMSLVCKLLRSF